MEQFVDQAELLRRLDREYQRFHRVIAQLPPEQLELPGVVGTWSIKEVIAHFIAHEQFALRELQQALRGETYHPDEDDSGPVNERAVAMCRDQSVADVLRAWETSYHQVVAAVQMLSAAAFEPAGPVVQALGDSIDGALGNNTYDHYAEHVPAIEAWMQQRTSLADNQAIIPE